ncbi:MAG: hypothetical protein U0V48_04425 [Anaerolineales bacterium]
MGLVQNVWLQTGGRSAIQLVHAHVQLLRSMDVLEEVAASQSENIVEQLKILKNEYGVDYIWFADENFSADQETLKQILNLIIEADLNLSLNINMTAADVVRDADVLPLYKAARWITL